MMGVWAPSFGRETVVFQGAEKMIGEKALEVWKRTGFESELSTRS